MTMATERLAINGGTPVRTAPFPVIGDSSGREIGNEELALLEQVVHSGALNRNNGKMVLQFEEKFARMLGVEYATASTSGTSSIHVAVGAINLNPGDEVITGPISDFGTVIPVLYQNAIPVFADLDPQTYNLDPKSVEERITPRTRAIIAVHLFGRPTEMQPLLDLAAKHNLHVIEDCCQAILAEIDGKLAGTMGHLGSFSFQQSKHMFTGDGGMTVTNDPKLGRRTKLFADKAWPRDTNERTHLFLAPNYRMTELQGAVGLAQLDRVRSVVERRRKVAAALNQGLANIRGLQLPVVPDNVKHSYWLYPMRLNEAEVGVARADFCKALQAEGIPASAGYIQRPMYRYDVLKYKRAYGESGCPWACQHSTVEYPEGLCPVAEQILSDVVILPCNEKFSEQDVVDIIAGCQKVAAHYGMA